MWNVSRFVIFLKFAFSKSLASSVYIPTRGGKRSPGYNLWLWVPILCQPGESTEAAVTPLFLSPNPPSKPTDAHSTSILPPHSHTSARTLKFVFFLGSYSPGLPPGHHQPSWPPPRLSPSQAPPAHWEHRAMTSVNHLLPDQQQPLLWRLLPFYPSTFLHTDILSWL